MLKWKGFASDVARSSPSTYISILVAIAADFSSALRLRMIASLLRQPADDARATARGDMITRLGTDIATLHQALVRVEAMWIPSVMTSLVLLIAILHTSAVAALAMAALIAPMVLVVHRSGRRHHESVQRVQENVAVLGTLADEALSGAREAKVFRRERALAERFEIASQRTARQVVREEQFAVTYPAVVTLVAAAGLGTLALVLVSSQRQGLLDATTLARLLALLALLVGPLQESIRTFPAVTRLATLLERCQQLLDLPVEMDPPGPIPPNAPLGRVSFEHVVVRRGATGFTLGPIDLVVDAGEWVAVMGRSGAGKSTLLELVPRLVEPSSGTVRVAGVDVRCLALDSLRSLTAWVPQDPYFFAGSLRENLLFAKPDASDAALRAACDAAHVTEFVARLPHGLATMLHPGGLNLSVGQRQRVAFARALLVDPRILLLDEPTAALDEETVQLFLAALRAFADERTVILVTHDPRVAALADRVVTIDCGGVVPTRGAPLSRTAVGTGH